MSADIDEQIALVLTLSQELAQACHAHDYDKFVVLNPQVEQLLAAVSLTLQQQPSLLTAERKALLVQLLMHRENAQQLLTGWVELMRDEMQSLNQNTRLRKTYSL